MLGFYCIVDIVVLLLVHSFHVPGTLPEIRFSRLCNGIVITEVMTFTALSRSLSCRCGFIQLSFVCGYTPGVYSPTTFLCYMIGTLSPVMLNIVII